MPALRVVLDTNVLVSGLAYPGSVPGRLIAAWREGGVDVVLSRYILDEFVRVLPRLPKVTLTSHEVQDLSDSLMFMADVVEPSPHEDERLRDATDQPVLATLLAADADYLVTGDKDLLELSAQYPIVRPRDFWERHGG